MTFFGITNAVFFFPNLSNKPIDDTKAIVQAPLAQIQNSRSLGTTTQIF